MEAEHIADMCIIGYVFLRGYKMAAEVHRYSLPENLVWL